MKWPLCACCPLHNTLFLTVSMLKLILCYTAWSKTDNRSWSFGACFILKISQLESLSLPFLAEMFRSWRQTCLGNMVCLRWLHHSRHHGSATVKQHLPGQHLQFVPLFSRPFLQTVQLCRMKKPINARLQQSGDRGRCTGILKQTEVILCAFIVCLNPRCLDNNYGMTQNNPQIFMLEVHTVHSHLLQWAPLIKQTKHMTNKNI